MAKASILLVPGSFAPLELYQPLIQGVEAKGYEIKALHLPTLGTSPGQGRDTAPPTMYEDAAFIAREAETLADEGKDVVIFSHSYGGCPSTESVRGLSLSARKERGKPGGVVRLAYISAVTPPVGESVMGFLADAPKEHMETMKADEKGWMSVGDHAIWASYTFSDLPPDEGMALIAKFPKHSGVSFANELTYAGYKDVPVSYLLCENDKLVVPEVQRRGIKTIERESGRKVDVTPIKADHCPMMLSLEAVVDWFADVAGKGRREL